MATFKPYFCLKDANKDGRIKLSIRLTHKRQSANIRTNIIITEKDLDRNKKNIKNNSILKLIADDISYYESLYNRNFAHKAESMTVQNLRDALFAYKNREGIGIDFYSFAEEHIRQMRENGQKGSASVYVSAVNCLKDFKPELSIQELRSDLLKEFENYMRRPRTITRNNGHSNITYHKEPMINSGVLSYMSRLRALFNAAKEKYNDDNNDITIIKHEPFVRYKMPVANMATKRSISEKEIARIINYEPNKDDTQLLKQARDVFMMMIYLSGINSIDLYYATPAIDGRINYNRHKTKRKRRDNAPMSIQIQPELQPLLEKYSDPANKYLLNFYKKYSDEKNFLRAIDKGLKSLGEKLNLSQKLTTYVARHSVATILSNKLNTSVDDVAICLNHVDPNKAITLTYIRTDFSKVDNANRKFIEYILEVAKKEKESINQKENTTFDENQKQCVQRKKLHSERTKLERLII